MDFEQAKSIPLAFIFDKLGYQPLQDKNHETLYQSPFSKREGDHLRLMKNQNIWIDEGINKRGNPVTFIITYLKFIGNLHSEKHALRWLEKITGSKPVIPRISLDKNIREEPGVRVKKIGKIEDQETIDFLSSKGVPHTLASRHMKQVQAYIPRLKKSIKAVGLQNEDRGWEIFNPDYPHLFTGTRNIYYIRGRTPEPSGVHIFTNIFDYYAAVITNGKRLKFDDASIIINSLTLLPKLKPHLRPKRFEIAHTWMPNSEQGRMATKSLDDFFRLAPAIKHLPQNKLYEGYEDINSWHCAEIEKMASK